MVPQARPEYQREVQGVLPQARPEYQREVQGCWRRLGLSIRERYRGVGAG